MPETLTSCPVCGYTDIRDLIGIMNRKTGDAYHYFNCQACGQLFLNPRMTDEETVAYYSGPAYRAASLPTPADYDRDLLIQEARAIFQFEMYKKVIFPLVHFDKKMPAALEIGCSAGKLLAKLNEIIWVIGVEPDKSYWPKTLPIYSTLEEMPKEYKFDIVFMSHVLEHLNHPVEYLKNLVANYTEPGAYFMIEVPHTEANWSSYQRHHPFAFTSFTLSNALQRAGLVLDKMMFHGLTENRPMFILAVAHVGEAK